MCLEHEQSLNNSNYIEVIKINSDENKNDNLHYSKDIKLVDWEAKEVESEYVPESKESSEQTQKENNDIIRDTIESEKGIDDIELKNKDI